MNARFGLMAVITAVITGVVLWFGFVVSLPRGETEAGPFWSWMTAAAFLLGVLFDSKRVAEVTMGLGLPPLVLSPLTAPRGDNDGPWVLWIPMLFAFILVLGVSAGIGGKVRNRLRHRRKGS